MPEILEVELYRTFAERALGRFIIRAWMVDDRYGRRGTTGRALTSAIVDRRFTAARRRGKLLLLDTDGETTLGVRFGMTGGLALDGHQALDRLRYGPGVFDQKWVRAGVGFSDGSALLVHDPRRFGSLELSPDVAALGPDALSVSLREVRQAVAVVGGRGSGPPLKARLMDQERLAGIGNLLADEILWRAALSPTRRGPLTEDEVRTLHRTVRGTLRQLARRGGSHTGDLMEERHRDGRCPKDGVQLLHAAVGGRTTYWCPAHQS